MKYGHFLSFRLTQPASFKHRAKTPNPNQITAKNTVFDENIFIV